MVTGVRHPQQAIGRPLDIVGVTQHALQDRAKGTGGDVQLVQRAFACGIGNVERFAVWCR